jgi:hypothetical protein
MDLVVEISYFILERESQMSTNITEHMHYQTVVNLTLDRWRSIREVIFRKMDQDKIVAEQSNNSAELEKIENICQELRNVTDYDFSNFPNLEEIQTYTPPILNLYSYGIWKPY